MIMEHLSSSHPLFIKIKAETIHSTNLKIKKKKNANLSLNYYNYSILLSNLKAAIGSGFNWII